MLNARLAAARRIADTLIPSEADIETAIASTARLIGAIAEARAEAKVSIAIGQSSLAALSATIGALVEARAGIGAAHAALARDRVDAGLRAYGMGDVSDCPSTATLSLVDDVRAAS